MSFSPPDPPPEPPQGAGSGGDPGWPPSCWDLPTALLAAAVFGVFYIVSSVAAVLVSMGPDALATLASAEALEAELTLSGLMVNWAGLTAGGMIAALLLPRLINRASWMDLGFRAASAKWMAAALVLGVAMAFVRLPLAQGLLEISPQFAEMAQDLQTAIMPERDPMSLIAIAVMTVFVVPFYEEVVFRSFVQTALRRVMRPWGAILVSSLLFSAYHLVPLQVIVVFPLAIVLAWIYERTRSLWPCVVAHMANNAVAIGLSIAYG